MTNAEIEKRMTNLVKEERRITGEILELINLADARKLFLERGFSSLFDWLTQGFGYSSSAAYRRIEAARLIRAVPAAAEKFENGTVNLTTLAQARQAIRAQEKVSGKLSLEKMAEAVEVIENKSCAAAEVALFELLPDAASSVHQERQVIVSAEETRLTINLSTEAMADLEWAKAFFSHSIPHGEKGKVVARALRELRLRHEKKGARAKADLGVRSDRDAEAESTAAAEVNRPADTKTKPTSQAEARRSVLSMAQRRCEYKDPETGRVCGSSYQIQIDHIIPRALGGEDSAENFRCLCAQHNRLMAEKELGVEWANSWREVK